MASEWMTGTNDWLASANGIQMDAGTNDWLASANGIRSYDLSLFAPHYVPTEEYMIEKLKDGLRQDLWQGLIALRFKSVRELIEAAQALEACIGESQGGH